MPNSSLYFETKKFKFDQFQTEFQNCNGLLLRVALEAGKLKVLVQAAGRTSSKMDSVESNRFVDDLVSNFLDDDAMIGLFNQSQSKQ